MTKVSRRRASCLFVAALVAGLTGRAQIERLAPGASRTVTVDAGATRAVPFDAPASGFVRLSLERQSPALAVRVLAPRLGSTLLVSHQLLDGVLISALRASAEVHLVRRLQQGVGADLLQVLIETRLIFGQRDIEPLPKGRSCPLSSPCLTCCRCHGSCVRREEFDPSFSMGPSGLPSIPVSARPLPGPYHGGISAVPCRGATAELRLFRYGL